jgi:AcrR family transcriptional regulator
MRVCMTVMTVLALLAPQATPAAVPAEEVPAWEAVAELVREASSPEETREAAQALLAWAEMGEAVSPQQVEDLLDTWQDDPVETAGRYAAVLDAAEEMAEAGRADVDEATYRAAARCLSPLFTRLLDRKTTPWRQEASAWPTDLADFDGIWCDSTMQELLIFHDSTCRVVIPYLDYYGETAYAARLRDRSAVGYCPSLEVDIHDTGTFQGPLAYYVSGLAEDHFWCNTQGQRFDRLVPGT